MHFCTQTKSLPTGGMRKNYRFCEKIFPLCKTATKQVFRLCALWKRQKLFQPIFRLLGFPMTGFSPTKIGKDAHGDCYRTGLSPVSLFTSDARPKRAEPDFAFGYHAAARRRRHFVHTNILFSDYTTPPVFMQEKFY